MVLIATEVACVSLGETVHAVERQAPAADRAPADTAAPRTAGVMGREAGVACELMSKSVDPPGRHRAGPAAAIAAKVHLGIQEPRKKRGTQWQ
jgi:hypothetical protein